MKHSTKWLAMLLAILTCLSVLTIAFAGCTDKGNPNDTVDETWEETPPDTGTTQPGNKIKHTFRVLSAGGLPLSKVTVAVYADAALSDVKGFGTTDEDGKVTIDLPAGNGYKAALTALPAGYKPEASYDVTGTDTTIKVTSAVIDSFDHAGINYKLGDVIRDFKVMDTTGKTYQLSELLKEKKMVMLNFWATWCGPCANEFPDMSAAYEAYKDQLEIIALDPDAEDTEEAIAEYKTGFFDFEIPFPMFKDTTTLSQAFAIPGYPTSVVIDRYGVICFVYSGALPSEAAIKTIFSHFTAENYEQKIVTNIEQLVEKEKPNIPMPSSEEIGAALGLPGATYAPETNENDAEMSWPFIISEKDGKPCIMPSNSGKHSSFATMYINVSLKKGEALAFDYYASTEQGNDVLYTLAKRADIGGDTYRDIYQISGADREWHNCVTYVADADGEYSIGLCYIKDSSGNEGEDTVYLRNLRIIKESDIKTPAYIPRYAASDLKEDHSGYNRYVTVVLNKKDGYYHVGSENGPLLLADLMKPTRFSQTAIYTFALDGQIVLNGKDYLNDLIPHASYASNSAIAGFCPVNEELKELLEITAEALGLENGNPNQWLQICSYYDAYGTDGKQLDDPTRGLYATDANNVALIDPYRTFTTQLGENEVVYDRLLMPRGLLSKFTPEKSGAYRILSKSEYLVEGWIFSEDGKEYYVYEGGERLFDDANNVSMVVYMEAGKNYYIDICYYDVYGTGTIKYYVEFLGETYEQFTIASPGFFTFPDGEEAGGALGDLAEILAGGIDVVLGKDGYYHEKRADGSEGSILYADFTNTTAIFASDSLQTLLDKGAFDFSKTESDEFILEFVKKHGDNTKNFLKEYWGEQYAELSETHKLDEVLAGKMHGTGKDLTADVRAYVEKIISSTENPELDGCVMVDEKLGDLLQKLMDKYTFQGVDHSWTKVCYYYRQLG